MKKKITSLALALTMLLSALPAASAINAEPLSEFAGETVSVHVTQIGADGQVTEAYVDVDVPKNATAHEEQDLLQTAAIAAVDPVARFNKAAERLDDLFMGSQISLNTSYKSVWPIYMEHDYTRLVFQLNFGTITGNPTNVTLRLTDEDSNVFTLNGALNLEYNGKKSAEIIVYENRTYGGNKIPMHNGARLDMEGKVNSGEIVFAGFMVKGYYNA